MTRDEIIEMALSVVPKNDREEAQNGNILMLTFNEIKAFAKLVAEREREACLDVIKTHRIPVGNSAAGEMACEWTYEALIKIVAKIQARGGEA